MQKKYIIMKITENKKFVTASDRVECHPREQKAEGWTVATGELIGKRKLEKYTTLVLYYADNTLKKVEEIKKIITYL